MARCAVFATLLYWLVASAQAEVVLVYTINRHGARNALPKSAFLKESDAFGGPTLLPLGERMCYDAGAAFRSRYVDPGSCGNTCLVNQAGDTTYGILGLQQEQPGSGFHNYNTLVRSSGLDRTIMSAQSFLAGVFPANASLATNAIYIPTGQEVVPVYTAKDENDWLIRAYTKCPAYDARLAQWYNSSEFQQKSAGSVDLRNQYKQLSPTTNVDLTNWWNVYDALNVYRTYGRGDPQPTVDNTTFAQISALAAWLETAKMRPELTGNLLGGPLLADMLNYMTAAKAQVLGSNPVYYKLLAISSHYNVQLGVLAALNLHNYPPAKAVLNWLDATLPQLASVVVFELHGANPNLTPSIPPSQFAVRLAVQQGPYSAAGYITVPLPCAVAGDVAESLAGPGACTWESFQALANGAALPNAAAWCSACGNTDTLECKVVDTQTQLDATQTQLADKDDERKHRVGLAVGLSIGLTFLATALLVAGLAAMAHHKAKRNWLASAHDQYKLESTISAPGI